MQFKHVFFLFLLMAGFFQVPAAAQTPAGNGFVIKAKLRGLTASRILLTYGGFHNSRIDSADVVDGEFTFTGKVDEPVPAMIFTRDYRVRFDLYIDNHAIGITGDVQDPGAPVVEITGPGVTAEFVAFNKTIMDNRAKVIGLFTEANSALAAKDSAKATALQAEGNRLYAVEFALRKDYIRAHPASYISGYELYAFSNVKNVKEAQALYDGLDERIRNSAQGVALSERLNLLGRVQVGESALAFVQQDLKGKKVGLGAYKGKYVLVEFWASWCGPCRAENPNLLQAYQKFRGKGFSILSVSLDNNRDAWLGAVKKDGLPWTQVSDLKGWNNAVAVQYGIKAIPANFLVGPDGKIVALDLRGEALQQKLAELL
ncbi:MAG TPA: TlpA disulfide reductase family protein [Chitinophagaceae bacterium]|nr:TlpA disulfide reductase family protein [Chitinophagaceae bacterium]